MLLFLFWNLDVAFTRASELASPDQAQSVITNLAQLERLAGRESRTLCTFKLEEIVCAVNSSGGFLVLQDDSAAELLELDLSNTSLVPGQRVSLEGARFIVSRGDRGLKLTRDSRSNNPSGLSGQSPVLLRQIGLAAAPVPRQIAIDTPAEGPEESRWAAVEGTVTFIHQSRNGLDLELTSGSRHTHVEVPSAGQVPRMLLLNSKIRAVGVCQTLHILSGELVLGRLSVCHWNQIQPLEAPPESWNTYPITKIDSLLQSNFAASTLSIVRVRGHVRSVNPGFGMIVEDKTNEVFVETAAPLSVGRGSEVEVLGQRKWSSTNVVLQFGFYRKITDRGLPLLNRVEAVKELSRVEAGRRYPVRVRGIVTGVATDTRIIRLQDESQGIFVMGGSPGLFDSLRSGAYVELEGTSDPGTFTPIIRARRLTVLGDGRLPEPIHPTWDQLLNGNLDSVYVELQGVVTALSSTRFTLLMRAHKLIVDLPGSGQTSLKQYENALVRLRGILVPRFDGRTHQVKPGEIRIDDPAFNVDQPAPLDVFSAPSKHAAELLLFDLQAGAFQRVKVSGEIIHGNGVEYYLMDGGKGLRFTAKEDFSLVPGDKVDVVGFVDLSGPSPALREAVARKVGHAPMPEPRPLRPDDLMNTRYVSIPVKVEGRLLSLRDDGKEQVLEMRTGARTFFARLKRGPESSLSLRPGSLLELTAFMPVSVGTGHPDDSILSSYCSIPRPTSS